MVVKLIETYKKAGVMICWSPAHGPFASDSRTRGQMALIAWPDKYGASDPYTFTSGACEFPLHDLDEVGRRHFIMSTALGAIIRDGLDPEVVHGVLWQLDEYRKALPEDVPSPDRYRERREATNGD